MKKHMKRNKFWLFAILGTVCLFLNISCSDALNFKPPHSFLVANISWPTTVFDGTSTKTIEVASITGTLSKGGSVVATVVNDSVVGSSALLTGKVDQPKSSYDLSITLTDMQGEKTTYRWGEIFLANNVKNPIDISLKGQSYIDNMPSSASFSQGETINLSISAYPSTSRIYYTTDGEVPTTDSMLYTGPITIEETTTVKAIAVCNGYVDSAISKGTYTKNPGTPIDIHTSLSANVSWPTAVFDGTEAKTIEVASITGTLSQDGSVAATVVNDSVTGSSALLAGNLGQQNGSYDLSITLADAQEKETIIYRGGEISLVSNAKNLIAVSLKGYSYITSMPSSVSFPQGDTIDISISAFPSTAKVYYTTDGKVPTTSSMLYTGPITIEETTTVKAIAVCNGYVDSLVSTGVYKENSDVSVEVPPLDTTPSIVTNDYKTFAAVLTGVTRTEAISYTWSLSPTGAEARKFTTDVPYITFDDLVSSERYSLSVKGTNGSQIFFKRQPFTIPKTSGAGK